MRFSRQMRVLMLCVTLGALILGTLGGCDTVITGERCGGVAPPGGGVACAAIDKQLLKPVAVGSANGDVGLIAPNRTAGRVVDWRHEHATDQRRAVGDHRAPLAPRAIQAQGRTSTKHLGSRRLDGDCLCLEVWHPLGDAAPGVGLREWHDLLAALA